MKKKLSGLFINCQKAQDSIYESGKMAYECLLNSEKYSLDYLEVSRDYFTIPANHDFYLFNYHLITMDWLDTTTVKKLLPGIKMTIVLEVSPNDPFVFCSPDDFDAYCVFDPTLNDEIKNAFAFPRPLETFNEENSYKEQEIPTIGSFGFATYGKGFEHVIDAVNREFDRAIVRLNIPYSTYADKTGQYAKKLARMCKNRAKAGIEVIVTHDFMTKSELIKWCGQNSLNCFLYDRNQPGLAATTDQAITSGRPLITSKNNTFRHIQKYIKPFPYQSLKEAIENSGEIVRNIQQDWSLQKFRERFEEVLTKFDFDNIQKSDVPVELTVFPYVPPQTGLIQTLKDTIAIRTRLKNFKDYRTLRRNITGNPKQGKSHSQFKEDLIINQLFADIPVKSISYLEISADNQKSFNNTQLFYEMGFRGLLVESDPSRYEKLKTIRPKDIVLNFGVIMNENTDEAYFLSDKSERTFSLSINEIIENYLTEYPDLISIDINDRQLQILKTFDFKKYSPAVFCVKTIDDKISDSEPLREELNSFFENNGYFSFKETKANKIFVNKRLYEFYLYQKKAQSNRNRFIKFG